MLKPNYKPDEKTAMYRQLILIAGLFLGGTSFQKMGMVEPYNTKNPTLG
jgi:hypothetical protein